MRVRIMFTKTDTLSTDLSTAIPQKKNIFLILVHFGDFKTTDALICSILAGSRIPDRIIVVDHAENEYRFSEGVGKISYIRPLKNKGYATGLRTGLEFARNLGAQGSDICILANNDLLLDPSSIGRVNEWWSINGSSKALAGPSMGSVSMITGRAHIHLKNVAPSFWHMEYVHGAFMVAEYGLLFRMNFFEHFFMYWEDVAMSRAVVVGGGVLKRIPNLVIHHDDRVGALPDSKLYYLVRNGAYVLERHSPGIWKHYWRIVNAMRRIYHGMHTRVRHVIILKALRDAKKMSL